MGKQEANGYLTMELGERSSEAFALMIPRTTLEALLPGLDFDDAQVMLRGITSDEYDAYRRTLGRIRAENDWRNESDEKRNIRWQARMAYQEAKGVMELAQQDLGNYDALCDHQKTGLRGDDEFKDLKLQHFYMILSLIYGR